MNDKAAFPERVSGNMVAAAGVDMDRRERIEDPIEAARAAQDGRQAELWTALPGIVQSFDPVAHTVTVQPCVQGSVLGADGKTRQVNLSILPDVPVVFPHGGGFSLTYPLKSGDEVLVVFASRCMDAWWQSGGVQPEAELRMHDLSDGIAIPGPWSQARKLSPPMDADNVQLRSDDGKAHVTMMPDYTIRAQNPTARVELTPNGEVIAEADTKITLKAPRLDIQASSITMGGLGGGRAIATLDADIEQTGWHTSTGDQVAGGVSQLAHTHTGDSGGTTGAPQ